MGLKRYQREELIALKQERERLRAKEMLLPFTCFTKDDYEINWHHRRTCKTLDQFARGEIKRLMIYMPPRHGKTEMASRRLPAKILGNNPDARILAASYADEFASMINRDVQRIIDSPQYAALFPDTKISEKRTSNYFEVDNRRGYYKSAGVGGPLTGMGGDFLLLDDPIKNQEQADSPTYREKVWDWYTSTFYTRLEKEGSILIILTRWHEDDLAGRLLKLAENDPTADQWTVVNFPAVREPTVNPNDPRQVGDALWANKYSVERLAAMKSSVGARVWNALFQQRPSALEGGIIKHSWIKYYGHEGHAPIPPTWHNMIQTWDLAFKEVQTSDFVVGMIIGVFAGKRYLLDMVRKRMGFVETCEEMARMSAKWPKAFRKLVEEKANGAAVIETMRRKGLTGIIPIIPTESKEARLSAVSAQFEAGDVLFPHPLLCPWINIVIDELTQFPNAVNDDTADALSQGLNDLSGGASVLDKIINM